MCLVLLTFTMTYLRRSGRVSRGTGPPRAKTKLDKCFCSMVSNHYKNYTYILSCIIIINYKCNKDTFYDNNLSLEKSNSLLYFYKKK